jgi:nucleotide-binding universal stress UspA family protein
LSQVIRADQRCGRVRAMRYPEFIQKKMIMIEGKEKIMKSPQKILVPTDFSQYADKALEEAMLLAKPFNSEIFLLHVVEDIQQCAVDYCLPQAMIDQYRSLSVNSSEEKLRKEIELYQKEAKDVKISINVRIGVPHEEILKEAEEKQIDLIVIASHGKTGFIQQIMGSVAERVSRRATCPVMLVKA